MKRKPIEYIFLIFFSLFILAIPTGIKKCEMRGGSTTVTGSITRIVPCSKTSNCFLYTYHYRGKRYYGETMVQKGYKIGSAIELEVAKREPEVSYPIWE